MSSRLFVQSPAAMRRIPAAMLQQSSLRCTLKFGAHLNNWEARKTKFPARGNEHWEAPQMGEKLPGITVIFLLLLLWF